METTPNSPAPLTLTGLNALVGNAVRMERRVQGVWVVAELTDVRTSGGHFYMELIEKDVRGATIAKLRANLWAGTAVGLRRKFHAATGRDIATGLKVMLYGGVTHHSLYGLSFNIQDIDPSYTMGDLERLRREILETLNREGVLQNNRNLPFPVAPRKIAVISAAGAAGYGDFTNQLENSAEGFKFYPLLFQAVMQGANTAPSVMAALDDIEMSLDFWDAVVIIRGGGSTSDLNGFDNLELARRVATFPLPIIVGIGHERDRTVLDDIACIRCKTPTAVAAFLIEALRKALERAVQLTETAARFTRERMDGERRRLQNAASLLPLAVSSQTAKQNNRLGLIGSQLELSAANAVKKGLQTLGEFSRFLSQGASLQLERRQTVLKHLEQLVTLLSPGETLKRGYSITRIDGHALTDATAVKPGAVIETTLYKGKITSKVSDNGQ